MLKIESKKPIPTVLKIVSKKLIPAVREIVPKKPIPAGLKIDPKKTIPPVFKSVMNQLSSDSQKFVSKESRWKSKFKLTNVTSPELLKNPWSEGRPKVPQERRILWSLLRSTSITHREGVRNQVQQVGSWHGDGWP